jgi:excisionase family DNA binding protein
VAESNKSEGPPPPLLVTPREAARLLSIGSRKLWELTNCGAIPSVRVGRALRYRPADIEQWVASRVTSR